MKNLLVLSLLSVVLFSCTKEDVEKPVEEELPASALIMVEAEMKDGTKMYTEQKRP